MWNAGVKRNVYGVLFGNSECRRLLGRPRFRWEDNIKFGWFLNVKC